MNTVRQLIKTSSTPYPNIGAETPVPVALKWMEKNNIDAAPVIVSGRLAGLLTETACARVIAKDPQAAHSRRVGEIMDCNPEVARPEQSYEEAVEAMNRGDVYHLPVVDGEQVVGMVSMREVVEALLSHHKGTIQFLQDLMLDPDAA